MGALYTLSLIEIAGNSTLLFKNNNTMSDGGAVYSYHSLMTFKRSCDIIFDHNTAKIDGGAIYSDGYFWIRFTGNSKVNFSNNNVIRNGGAVLLRIIILRKLHAH